MRKDFLSDACVPILRQDPIHLVLDAELQFFDRLFLVSRETFQGSEHELAEREILNLAVAPSFRRKGIAKTLLGHELRRRAAFFLEVRESNMAAQNLYFQFGFREIARRPRYYQDPSEGAIVMQMKKC